MLYVTPQVLNSATTDGVNIQFRANGLYDVDPALASAEVPGFVEMMALYSKYRVIGYSYEIQLSNAQDFPVTVTVLNTNDTFTGGGGLNGYAGNQFTQQTILASKSGGRCTHTFRGSHSIRQIVGSGDVEFDDEYVGTVASNPTRLVRLAIGVYGYGNTLSTGVFYILRLRMRVRYFSRIQQS